MAQALVKYFAFITTEAIAQNLLSSKISIYLEIPESNRTTVNRLLQNSSVQSGTNTLKRLARLEKRISNCRLELIAFVKLLFN